MAEASCPKNSRVKALRSRTGRAQLLRVDERVGKTSLEYSTLLGRSLRIEDIDTVGISTQTLAERAVEAGEWAQASELAAYAYSEMQSMDRIMTSWISQLISNILGRLKVEAPADVRVAAAMVRPWLWVSVGKDTLAQCEVALLERDAPRVGALLEQMRIVFRERHDAFVALVQELLAYIAETWGEDAVLDSILQVHGDIWGKRYEAWNQMTPLEKVALTVEGMRGGHFSGAQRRGDVSVSDEGDRYKIVMDPCGSGGVLRRGDPETGREPYPAGGQGVNHRPHLWTWQKTGVHWYCVHCCVVNEWHSGRERGRPMRPLDHVLDPKLPCTRYVYKDEAQTRAYHYPRVGLPLPPDAPDHGEGPNREYPGALNAT